MLRNLNVSKRIHIITFLLMGICLLIMAFTVNWGIRKVAEISVFEAQQIMLENQKDKLRIAVHSMAESLGQMIKKENSLERRKQLIRQSISAIRFEKDNSGYYFVYDFSGVNIAHPLRPEFQGTNRLSVRDLEGKDYIRQLRDKAKKGGFVQYTFEKPGMGNVLKLAYAEAIPGTNYWIATGFYMDNIEARKEVIRKKIEKMADSLSLTLTGILLLILFFIVFPLTESITRSITKPLRSITQAVQTITSGHLEVTVDSSGNDELSILGASFNEMAANLAQTQQSLTAYRDHLELLVKQRTEELSESLDKLALANNQILDSIQYARRIQNSILPPARLISEYLQEYFVIWEPKDIIGGDIYWFKGDNDKFLLGVIDCTGHGVPGAIMTMIAVTTLGRVVSEIGPTDPARILEKMDKMIKQILSQNFEETECNDGLDIGLCYIPNDGTAIFAGAKISLYIMSGSESKEFAGDHFSIGYKESKKEPRFINQVIDIQPGMSLYLTTDGLKDQVGGENKLPLGKSRLLDLLRSVQHLSFPEQKKAIIAEFEEYSRRCLSR